MKLIRIKNTVFCLGKLLILLLLLISVKENALTG